jgi:hypothetical protein
MLTRCKALLSTPSRYRPSRVLVTAWTWLMHLYDEGEKDMSFCKRYLTTTRLRMTKLEA